MIGRSTKTPGLIFDPQVGEVESDSGVGRGRDRGVSGGEELASFFRSQRDVKCSCSGDCDRERDAAEAEILRLRADRGGGEALALDALRLVPLDEWEGFADADLLDLIDAETMHDFLRAARLALSCRNLPVTETTPEGVAPSDPIR